MEFKYKYQDIKVDERKIKEHALAFQMPEDIVRLLHYKGINSKEALQSYLEPTIEQFRDPFLFRDMRQVVDKIKLAIKNKKKIIIVGDYDTDGICATAILYIYLKEIGGLVSYYLPNRFSDGYGLTCEVVRKIKNEFQPDLLITVDCGISCHKEIELAKNLGIDVIVSDHHELPETLPDCLTINPKEEGGYPFKNLCGAGVALKIVHALGGIDVAQHFVFICALATVADIVPLVDENRAIVSIGLNSKEAFVPKGIRMLIKELQIKNLTSSDISFKVAPKLNTAGRMGDASIALKLFLETNTDKLHDIISELSQKNDLRLIACSQITEECKEMLSHVNVSRLKAIVLYKPDWANGVLGIVCSKLVDIYNKPVCLLSMVDDAYKGSARSIPGIDIFSAMGDISDLLIQFGGHNQAGGLTVKSENVSKLSDALNKALEKYPQSLFAPVKYYDFDFNKVNPNIDFIEQMKRLEPFGLENEKPLFLMSFSKMKASCLPNFKNHIKMTYEKISVVGYNYGQQLDMFNSGCNKKLLVDVDIDTFFTKPRLKAVIKNLVMGKVEECPKQEVLFSNYLQQINKLEEPGNFKITHIAQNDVKEELSKVLGDTCYGTLIVANTFDSYISFLKQNIGNISNYELFHISNQTGINTIILSPKELPNLTNYNNIIFLDRVLCNGYLKYIANKYNINIYCVNNGNSGVFKALNCNRQVFAMYHNAIISSIVSEVKADSEQEYFYILKQLNPQIKNLNLAQFTFVTMVLKQLGILSFQNGGYKVNENVRSQLSNSSIYSYIEKELSN